MGCTETNGVFKKQVKNILVLNAFQANVSLMKKPGSCFLLATFMTNNSSRVTFNNNNNNRFILVPQIYNGSYA